MARPRTNDQQGGFALGLDTATDPLQLEPGAVRRAENTRMLGDGVARKRKGTRRLTAAAMAAPVQAGLGWVRPGAATIEVVAANLQLHTGSYALPTTFTAQTGAIDTSANPCLVAFRDATQECVYCFDGTSVSKILADGTVSTVTLANGGDDCTWAVVLNNRLVAGGGASAPNQVYWSPLGDGDGLGDDSLPDPGGVAVVETYGEGEVIAGGVAGGSLFLMHPSAISIFTGITSDDISIASGTQGLSADVGTIARRSVVSLDDAVVFLSDRGFYFASASGVEPISRQLEPTLRSLDFSSFDGVCAVHARERREVWWYLPGLGVLVYAYERGVWSGPWKGAYNDDVTTALWASQDEEGRPIVLRGTEAGWVERCDYALTPIVVKDSIASDGTGGSNITATIRCRPMTHGDPTIGKSWREMALTGNLGGSQQVGVYLTSPSLGAIVRTFTPMEAAIIGPGLLVGQFTLGGDGVATYIDTAEGDGPYADCVLVDGSDRMVEWSDLALEASVMNKRRYGR